MNLLVDLHCIDDGKKIWWDIRPHPTFGTLEFRVCDVPTRAEETLALAAIAQAVIALRGHHQVAFGWISALTTFLIVTAVAGDDLLLRVNLGLVSGSTVALVWFAFALRARIRAGAQPDKDSLVEALLDLPLEP